MNIRTTKTRRGVALLIVLVTTVLLLALLTPFVESAALLAFARRQQRRDDACRDFALAADAAILHWLNRDSQRARVDPAAETPSILVLDDLGQVADESFRVVITAFDECGMTPLQLVGVDRTLSGRLPADLRSLGLPARPFGLDQLHSDRRPVFPLCEGGAAAVGALVATHNPPEQSGATPAININTAPEPLLRAAFLATGSGDPEPILALRARGSVASLRAGALHSPSGVRLVNSSNCWGFRLDVRIGPHRRAWWFVYARHGSVWVRVQSIPISEMT